MLRYIMTLCDNPTTRRISGIPTERNAMLGTWAQHMNLRPMPPSPASGTIVSCRT